MICVLLGTSTLALPTAEALLRGTACRLTAVITKPTEFAGRKHVPAPPPVAVWATEHRVPLHQPQTKDELTVALHGLQPDIAVVIAYGKMIPKDALSIPRFGCVNLHPSLLPHYRGPSPVQVAVANGDAETGVTLILLDEQMDHGPILAQERLRISPTVTRSRLDDELAALGASLLERILPDYLSGRIVPQPQDHTRATITPLLSRDHGRINWHDPAMVIERKIRAYEGWPGSWCGLPNGKRLKVLHAVTGGPTSESPGTILPSPDGLDVACGSRQLLTLLTVQPEGRSVMDGRSFRVGHRTMTKFT